MLVALQCEKKNESTIKDLLNSVNLDFKLFCSGTLEEVGESLMEKCNKCQNRITSMDSKEGEKLWILFILKKKNGLFMLNLLETINVKTFKNVREFFDSEQLCCSICIGKNYRKRPLSLEEPPVTTAHLTMDNEVKAELEDETVQKANKPVILRPRLAEIALVKASDIVVKEDKKNINVVKKEEDSNSLAVETSSIATEDIKQEQQDERINEKVTAENMGSPNVKRARIEVIISEPLEEDIKLEVLEEMRELESGDIEVDDYPGVSGEAQKDNNGSAIMNLSYSPTRSVGQLGRSTTSPPKPIATSTSNRSTSNTGGRAKNTNRNSPKSKLTRAVKKAKASPPPSPVKKRAKKDAIKNFNLERLKIEDSNEKEQLVGTINMVSEQLGVPANQVLIDVKNMTCDADCDTHLIKVAKHFNGLGAFEEDPDMPYSAVDCYVGGKFNDANAIRVGKNYSWKTAVTVLNLENVFSVHADFQQLPGSRPEFREPRMTKAMLQVSHDAWHQECAGSPLLKPYIFLNDTDVSNIWNKGKLILSLESCVECSNLYKTNKLCQRVASLSLLRAIYLTFGTKIVKS